jgi:4-amino-4-deoxy-L-arabinose transferase-like glycosyltransferase
MVSDFSLKPADIALLAGIFAVLVILALLCPPIAHHGEAREGLVVQEIVHNHQWILPYRNGELPSKPPLFHWIAALLAHLFGLSDTIIRLPSAIAAGTIAVATFLLGGKIGGRRTAWLAVGALVGMFGFWDAGTEARVDMVFSACVTVSLAAFFFWYGTGGNRARAFCYLASACAVLAKGPAGIVLPGSVAVVFLALERRLDLIGRFWSWPLVVATLIVDLGWYALAARIGGREFLALQIGQENFDQFLGTGGFTSRNDLFSMAVWIATRLLPWNLALLWALVRRMRGEREDSAGRFLHAWWIAIFAIFFVATGKRAYYLIPLYPAVALLAARAIARLAHRAATPSAAAPSLTRTPAWVVIPIVVIDLSLILAHPLASRRRMERQREIVPFAKEISRLVPKEAPLYADPAVPNSEMIILAYRLDRQIPKRSFACAERNSYFLLPMRAGESDGRRVLAFSKAERLALVFASSAGKNGCPPPADAAAKGPGESHAENPT